MPTLYPLATRRQIITQGAAAAALAGAGCFLSAPFRALAQDKQRAFKIGACDWSIGAMGRLTALRTAAKLGLDGAQVSFGKPGDGDDLRKEETRAQYAEACKKYGIEIASLGMGVLNNVPLATSDDAEKWVGECIEIMPKMNQKRVLLAFFAAGDVKDKPGAEKAVIERLKRLAPKAEKAGVTLGFESWLNAADHMRIIDAVGSPALKVYYDVCNMTDKGYNIYEEIPLLGKKGLICEIHFKENGARLGEGKVDFSRVRKALDEAGYSGWLVLEGAVPKGSSFDKVYPETARFVRGLFPEGARSPQQIEASRQAAA